MSFLEPERQSIAILLEPQAANRKPAWRANTRRSTTQAYIRGVALNKTLARASRFPIGFKAARNPHVPRTAQPKQKHPSGRTLRIGIPDLSHVTIHLVGQITFNVRFIRIGQYMFDPRLAFVPTHCQLPDTEPCSSGPAITQLSPMTLRRPIKMMLDDIAVTDRVERDDDRSRADPQRGRREYQSRADRERVEYRRRAVGVIW